MSLGICSSIISITNPRLMTKQEERREDSDNIQHNNNRQEGKPAKDDQTIAEHL